MAKHGLEAILGWLRSYSRLPTRPGIRDLQTQWEESVKGLHAKLIEELLGLEGVDPSELDNKQAFGMALSIARGPNPDPQEVARLLREAVGKHLKKRGSRDSTAD